MTKAAETRGADKNRPPRLYGYSLSFLRKGRTRDILQALGRDIHIGLPKKSYDSVAVWGRTNTAKRGLAVASSRNCDTLTLEDGFLRSLKTGRQGDAAQSLILDEKGIYFDADGPNDFADLMEEARLISGREFEMAEAGLEQLKALKLSKYNAHISIDETLPKDFVLVIDQTLNDASVRFGDVDESHFSAMLRAAIKENPGKDILIKTHPETSAGKRQGYFSKDDESSSVKLLDKPYSPWDLFARASKVYCVTSQLGMEAIFAGHRPVVYGRAFYAGWGMTDDRHSSQIYKGLRAPVHLFWAAYLGYCNWYDPYKKEITDFDVVARNISTQAREWRENQQATVFFGMRVWKRSFLQNYLSGEKPNVHFIDRPRKAVDLARKLDARLIVWASKETDELRQMADEEGVNLIRMEDGFIRSTGLGADLIPPLSLALDDLGIYYDPTRESTLEYLIQNSTSLKETDLARAKDLRMALVKARLTKYNLKGHAIRFNPKLKQRLVLIPGQVEDDASILKGTGEVSTNQELIWAVRQRFPNAFLIYKPHPDVEAGLRQGEVNKEMLKGVVDHVAVEADIGRLLGKVDIVATMTSLTGFEALLRGKRVVCFGTPFYAGWGLTEDHGEIPVRRKAKISLDHLVHSTLIDYPKYWDPVTGDACTPETILHRFSQGKAMPKRSTKLRWLSKLQGRFSSFAHLWR